MTSQQPRPSRTVDPAAIYAPVLADLPQVEQVMQDVARVEFSTLSTLVGHVLSKPGKRLRPTITLLAGKLFDYNLEKLIPMAASVELLHTATLVHDDTLDKAAVRHSTPTVHTMWDINTAVLFGDFMFAAAAEMVSRTANVRVMRLFAQTLGVICGGELSQHFHAYSPQISREEYFSRIGQKTASLFAMATESGAVLSGASEEQVELLRRFGYQLGVAFQIADDLLDFTGDAETVGKPVGADLLQGTLTLPAILFLERYPDQNLIRHFLENGYSQHDLPAIVHQVRTSGVLDEVQELAADYSRDAAGALQSFPTSPARDALLLLTEYALQRNT